MTNIPVGQGFAADPAQVSVEVEYRDQVIIARLAGILTLQAAPALRVGLLKCLADYPDALIVDVADLAAESDLPLTVLRVVQRQAHRWPAIPMVLCRPDAALTLRLARAGRDGYPRSYPSVDEAIANLDRIIDVRPAIHSDLLPTVDSCPRARDLVAHACHEWGVADIAAAAEVVVSELVSNAVLYARPPLHLLLAMRDGHLHVAVRDGSPVLPQPVRGAVPPSAEHGRGLQLIDSFTAAWGSVPTAEGKVVWATLRLPR
jgi:hypothetical protein